MTRWRAVRLYRAMRRLGLTRWEALTTTINYERIRRRYHE